MGLSLSIAAVLIGWTPEDRERSRQIQDKNAAFSKGGGGRPLTQKASAFAMR